MARSATTKKRPLDNSRIAFVASSRPEALEALAIMRRLYGHHDEADASVIVALGGDGLMLDTLRRRFDDNKPVFGMNRGTVGFLMNAFAPENLRDRLDQAIQVSIQPLRMRVQTLEGRLEERLAINEVSLLRQTHQSAHLRISVDGKERLNELACDGILLATPAGSTAYNLSAHGPILPIGARLLALTPISAFRPRRWRGALLRHGAKVRIEAIEPNMRPVSASADNQEVRNLERVDISEDTSKTLMMLFDPGAALEEKILSEQFMS